MGMWCKQRTSIHILNSIIFQNFKFMTTWRGFHICISLTATFDTQHRTCGINFLDHSVSPIHTALQSHHPNYARSPFPSLSSSPRLPSIRPSPPTLFHSRRKTHPQHKSFPSPLHYFNSCPLAIDRACFANDKDFVLLTCFSYSHFFPKITGCSALKSKTCTYKHPSRFDRSHRQS